MNFSDIQSLLLGVAWTLFGVASGPKYWPILPPSYPLAVRNPYLSTWMPGNHVPHLPSSSPQFWAGQNLTWGIMVRVDGVAYNVFGVPKGAKGTKTGFVKGATYTSTHSIFELTTGAVDVKLDFFSPVSPSNYLRQSLPFSKTLCSSPKNLLTFFQVT
jgi:hypothetical protein